MEYARKATGSAAAITDAQGRVLLVRRNYPPHDWVLPGGNAEPGESPIETVLREVREELFVDVTPRALAGVYYQADHRAGEFLHFVFHCDVTDVNAPQPNPEEIADYGYWPAHALPEPMSESTRLRIRDAVTLEPMRLPVSLPPRSEPAG